MEPKLTNTKGLKTYLNLRNKTSKSLNTVVNSKDNKSQPLTTKDAVRFLLEGTLKWRVCRFCLTTTEKLSELDEILEIASSGAMYQVKIRDMVSTFHPFQILDDTNFPNKICSNCLDRTINSYLFTQQCERAERALRNCFNDINEKFDKLDPLERVKRRGRQKLNPNHNVLHADYKKVMSYAEPIINIINSGSTREHEADIKELECPKCWQVLPNIESFANHEKIHPKTMWYNCRVCGNSFVKHSQYKRHIKQCHIQTPKTEIEVKKEYKCTECDLVTKEFGEHLQHIEKHKFKNILEHLIIRKMDDLCGVCLDVGEKMVELDETFYLHAGYPELTGEKTLARVLRETVPEMNSVNNYVGTKICEKCLNHALTSYIFLKKIRYTRSRLDTCIGLMLANLNSVSTERNVMVEIAKESILPLMKRDEELDAVEFNHIDDMDDSQLKIEVLEDEFRIETETSDSEQSNDGEKIFDDLKKTLYPINAAPIDTKKVVDETNVQSELILNNPAKDVTKTYVNKKLVNGFQQRNDEAKNDVCSEFLTFKEKPKAPQRLVKFTCPMCSKHFISDYFLKKHVLKHVNMRVECPLCSAQCKSKFRLSEHVKIAHTANNYSECRICGRAFSSKTKLSIHRKTHYMKDCQLCGKLFKAQKSFDNHFQRHAVKFNTLKNRKSQTCSFCEKECSNENELSLHVNKSHLQIKPYSCDMCDKQFYTEYNLSSHKRVHSFSSIENCEFCDRVFKCRKSLVVHVRRHIGSRPHHCHVCRQSFYSESGRNAHMKKVHGGRLCCRLCKSVFNRKLDLKAHVNVAHNAM